MGNDPFVLKREADSEPFTATIGDVTLTMPHINDLDQFEMGDMYARDHASDLSFLLDFFTVVMGDGVKELRDMKLKRPELLALYTAYLAHAGTSEGESQASSD